MLKHHCSAPWTFFLMLNHHHSALFVRPLSFITETPNSHPFSPSRLGNLLITFSHFLTILHRRNNSVQQLFCLSPSFVETPLSATFHYFLMLKHHCSALCSRSQNTPVRHFLTIFIDETIMSSNCFAFSLLLLKHHYQQPFIIFPDSETPLFSTFDFLPLLKHHYQQPFIIVPDAETPLFITFDLFQC
jgi:hypothetical protein